MNGFKDAIFLEAEFNRKLPFIQSLLYLFPLNMRDNPLERMPRLLDGIVKRNLKINFNKINSLLR